MQNKKAIKSYIFDINLYRNIKKIMKKRNYTNSI